MLHMWLCLTIIDIVHGGTLLAVTADAGMRMGRESFPIQLSAS